MFNLNDVVREQSCPCSAKNEMIMIACVTHLSEKWFPLETIDAHES
jgi:hypothetical protein